MLKSRPKNNVMTLRLNEEELALLKKAAVYSKLAPGPYIRMVVLQEAEKRVRFYEKIKTL